MEASRVAYPIRFPMFTSPVIGLPVRHTVSRQFARPAARPKRASYAFVVTIVMFAGLLGTKLLHMGPDESTDAHVLVSSHGSLKGATFPKSSTSSVPGRLKPRDNGMSMSVLVLPSAEIIKIPVTATSTSVTSAYKRKPVLRRLSSLRGRVR